MDCCDLITIIVIFVLTLVVIGSRQSLEKDASKYHEEVLPPAELAACVVDNVTNDAVTNASYVAFTVAQTIALVLQYNEPEPLSTTVEPETQKLDTYPTGNNCCFFFA